MFGFSFYDKVVSVLRRDFDYRPYNIVQKMGLKEICADAKRHGVSEVDAAILFMLVQMNLLEGGGEDVKAFVATHSRNVEKVLPRATSPREDILAKLSMIRRKHGIGGSTKTDHPSTSGFAYGTFEAWLQEFKRVCAEVRPGLAVDKDGGSLIDFMDHEPLRRAFRDRVAPETVARPFAAQFDINSFGRR